MRGRFVSSLASMLFLAAPDIGSAQSARELVGTWELVSSVNTARDGTKSDVFGPNPKGILMFDNDGRFAQVFTRPELPKFASGDRLQGTPDENRAIVQGSIAMFGTYSISDKVLMLYVQSGTWPGWIGTDQKRPLTSYTGDEMSWTQQEEAGATTLTTLRRLD